MYAFFNEAHRGLAILSVLFTLGWLGVVLAVPSASAGLKRPQRLVYAGAMASTGLVGLTGLVVTAMGPWLATVFPWLGLAAVAGHGIAGARSRKALLSNGRAAATAAAICQVVLLVAAYGLMTVKPF